MSVAVKPDNRVLDFTPENEAKALKLLCIDKSFALKWYGRIEAHHWQNEWNALIFRAVDYHYRKYSDIPTTGVLEQQFLQQVTINDPVKDMIQYLHNEVLGLTIVESESKYLKDRLMEHIEQKDWTDLVYEIANHVREGTFKDIPKAITAVAGRHTLNEIEPEYGAESVEQRLEEETADYSVFPSQFPTFNLRHGGGNVAGTVKAYMGPTGSGKSILLVNEGVNALKQGKNVFHFTFELSKRKTQARYDVALTGYTYDQRSENPHILDNTLKDMRKNGLGKLYVIERPNGVFSTNDVKACIEEYAMATGIRPDVVILDYLSTMMPNDPSMTDMSRDYSKFKTIAEDIRSMAMAFRYYVVTALQTNRDSMNRVDTGIRKDGVADSFAALHVLDDVLSINQNDADKKHGKLHLFNSKCRDFDDNYWISCSINYGNLRVLEVVEETKYRNDNMGKQEQSLSGPPPTPPSEPKPIAATPATSGSPQEAVADMLLRQNELKSAPTKHGYDRQELHKLTGYKPQIDLPPTNTVRVKQQSDQPPINQDRSMPPPALPVKQLDQPPPVNK